MCLCVCVYYKALAHVIMEAKKSQDPQSGIWRPQYSGWFKL